MKNRIHGLSEREMEPAKLMMADCKTPGTIEQMLEAEMDEHLGYGKNSVEGGLRTAVNSIFPKTKNQLCIVHQIPAK